MILFLSYIKKEDNRSSSVDVTSLDSHCNIYYVYINKVTTPIWVGRNEIDWFDSNLQQYTHKRFYLLTSCSSLYIKPTIKDRA